MDHLKIGRCISHFQNQLSSNLQEVVVEYEYEALHEDELTLRLGDIITNVRYIEEDGWMEGDLNGKRGLFPDNFVKELKKECKDDKDTKPEPKEDSFQPQKRETGARNVADLVKRISTIGIPTGGFQPQPPAVSKKPKKRQCKALFDYLPQNEDELALKIGDIIDITEEVEEGWWSGNLNGKSGLFPSNFVKEMDTLADDGESKDATAEETDGSGAESAETPTSPPSTSGNGSSTHPKKIRGGVGFGNIFGDPSFKRGRFHLPSDDTEEKKPIPSLPADAKPAPPNVTESQKADGDSRSKAKEYCKVTYDYEATNEDELTLKEGDIIHLVSKDTGEPGWWRGKVGDREGVFPDNFVTMTSEAEKEASVSRGSLKSSAKQETEEASVSRGSLKSSAKQETEELPTSQRDTHEAQKPKKPPPPAKNTAHKPEVPSADKKPHLVRPEDRVDKPTPDHKPLKPAAPVVPPKKPVPPPGKARSSTIPPKRPDKPLAPSPSHRHNGELPSTRPKSDFEPLLHNRPTWLLADVVDKPTDVDLMSFDELSSTSEKLSHPTANRPKMPGRRLPAQFAGGQSPNKEVSVEKSFKIDEEDGAKPKLSQTRKPSTNNLPQSTALHKFTEAKPSQSEIVASQDSRTRLEPEEPSSQLEELRNQMKELQVSVELIKAQQTKEMAELRRELDEEKHKRVSLQMEIEKLKRTIQST
ncbi:CD2-associated protein isoform 2-T2 [Pholidichthys leucotaenia]